MSRTDPLPWHADPPERFAPAGSPPPGSAETGVDQRAGRAPGPQSTAGGAAGEPQDDAARERQEGAAREGRTARPDRPLGGVVADSLAASVLLVLILAVAQRLVGFVRNVLFCRMLDDHQLGQWALAYNFLLLAAPLVTLGLPGSFARYVEHYRHRGQLWTFVARILAITVALTILGVLTVLVAPGWYGWLVFGDASQLSLVACLAVALVAVVAFNALHELFTALRQIRLTACLQMINSLLFAAVALGLIAGFGMGADAAVIGYGAACLATAVAGAWLLSRTARGDASQRELLGHGEFWRRIGPFAVWLWGINFLSNLFAIVDCSMIVHFSGLDTLRVQSLLGQYHSSRVLPLLLIGVALMMSHVILPHLSEAWERGRRAEVVQRLHLALRSFAWGLTVASLLVMLGAPLLFHWALDGRYGEGLAVLPWVLLYGIWFSLFALAQNYLWCAEKGRWGMLALAGGLAVNVALNLLLVPRWELTGAVVATACGTAVALAVAYALCARLGMRIDYRIGLATLLATLVLLPPLPALLALALASWLGVRQGWLVSGSERQQLGEIVRCRWQSIVEAR